MLFSTQKYENETKIKLLQNYIVFLSVQCFLKIEWNPIDRFYSMEMK